MKNQRSRFLLIYPYPDIDSNPTMALLLETLSARRIEVDVLFCEDSAFSSPKQYDGNVNFIAKPSGYFSAALTSMPRSVHNYLWHLPMSIYKAGKYSTILGVDPSGLILADHFNRWAHLPLVYISFEILFRDEASSPSEEKMKNLEISASKNVSLALVQDEERAKALVEENSFPQHTLAMVPNSPRPQARVQSDYLRKKLNIPPEKKIVLYCGLLTSWSSRDEIQDTVSYWPKNYVLVIHMRQVPDRRMTLYLQNLKKTNKVFFSNRPIPMENMTEMVSSADFGIAPYKPTPDSWTSGKNIFHMGLSSGKVAYYAMCGLPMIGSALPVYKREFKRYNCGLIYERIAEIGDLLEELDQNYEQYSVGAKYFYEKKLNPIEPMNSFVNRLLKVCKIEYV